MVKLMGAQRGVQRIARQLNQFLLVEITKYNDAKICLYWSNLFGNFRIIMKSVFKTLITIQIAPFNFCRSHPPNSREYK